MLAKQFKRKLFIMIDILPKEKVIELFDFAKFLTDQYLKKTKSAIDENSLFLQQQSLSKIWDNPEEDIYEL